MWSLYSYIKCFKKTGRQVSISLFTMRHQVVIHRPESARYTRTSRLKALSRSHLIYRKQSAFTPRSCLGILGVKFLSCISTFPSPLLTCKDSVNDQNLCDVHGLKTARTRHCRLIQYNEEHSASTSSALGVLANSCSGSISTATSPKTSLAIATDTW